MNSSAQPIQLSDLPDPLLAQYRMRQLSVLNWGTFSGLHRMQVAQEGMLLLGPSGAGKSTLLDAISALTAPPRFVRFNAAADESSRKDQDRNLMSYVRGAWAEKADEETPRLLAKQYLRPHGTWSALALEYANAAGRVVTLVRVMWVRGAATSGGVETHFMLVDGAFDLTEIPDFEGERRNIKKQLKRAEIRHHENSFAAYAEHWCRVLGIEDSNALELLHQTQSTKNLSDLNAFLRDFMLAEPATFKVATDLITEFVDLDEAHRAVVSARRQVELLGPARQAFTERTQLASDTQQLNELIAAIVPFRASIHAQLLVDEQHRLDAQHHLAKEEHATAHGKIADANGNIEHLQAQYTAKGGGELSSLDKQRQALEEERRKCQRYRDQAEQHAKALGWTLAAELTGFVEQVQWARRLVDEADQASASIEEKREQATIAESKLADELKSLHSEIKALESSPSSIPLVKQQIRARLSQDLGIPLSKIPFAGELIEVKPEHSEWAGAANRLMGGFATTLLVHDDDYRKVASWVEQNHLRDKWSYTVVSPSSAGHAPHVDDRSIVRVVEIKQHPFRAWVAGQLARQFDFERVDSVAELIKGERRITKAGQIKFSGRRHEKDDRHDINDRRFWVLGDNREKLTRFREDATAVLASLEQARTAKRQALEQSSTLSEQKSAARLLSQVHWQDIDVASLAMRIQKILSDQSQARAQNTALTDLEGQLIRAKQELQNLLTAQATAMATMATVTERLTELEGDLQSARIESMALSPTHRSLLEQRMPTSWPPTLKSYRNDVDQLQSLLYRDREVLGKAIKEAEMLIVAIFTQFLNQWPAERGALQPNLESAPDFFAKLQRIELDGLPAHEERFLHLLRTQSTQRLAELYRHLSEARKDIEVRLDDVNIALRTVPYNPDSFLRLRVEDLGLEEPREFRRRLAEVFQRHQSSGADPIEAEKQFDALRQLILDLRGDEPEKKRWRELVLDVRKHVHFIADELEHRTERLIENYSGSGGKSGGQRQKLTATCLAAALRFQLGGTDGGPPSYAAVVLDEAFTKTDNDFTATCMRIFTELGFQMIVATPIKSVMTLEPFVGGATYVSISNRHTSSMQHIAYVQSEKRLDLPDIHSSGS